MKAKKIDSPAVETQSGMAEGVKEAPVVVESPGNYFIVTWVEERQDFWIKEVDGSMSEDDLFRKHIRGSLIPGTFKIYKGKEIKIRR